MCGGKRPEVLAILMTLFTPAGSPRLVTTSRCDVSTLQYLARVVVPFALLILLALEGGDFEILCCTRAYPRW